MVMEPEPSRYAAVTVLLVDLAHAGRSPDDLVEPDAVLDLAFQLLDTPRQSCSRTAASTARSSRSRPRPALGCFNQTLRIATTRNQINGGRRTTRSGKIEVQHHRHRWTQQVGKKVSRDRPAKTAGLHVHEGQDHAEGKLKG